MNHKRDVDIRRTAGCAAVLSIVAPWFNSVPAGAPVETAAKVVFLLRHAEKISEVERDPDLSLQGVERAERLARLLAEAGVTHLFSSEFRRTQKTLEPLARSTSKAITIISARGLDQQVQALRDLPAGSIAVVCGHSNTLPRLVRELGGNPSRVEASADGESLPQDEYQRLYMMVLENPPEARPITFLELCYGQ